MIIDERRYRVDIDDMRRRPYVDRYGPAGLSGVVGEEECELGWRYAKTRSAQLLTAHVLSGQSGSKAVELLVDTLICDILDALLGACGACAADRKFICGFTWETSRLEQMDEQCLGCGRLGQDMCLGLTSGAHVPLLRIAISGTGQGVETLMERPWACGALVDAIERVVPLWIMWRLELSAFVQNNQFCLGQHLDGAARLGLGTRVGAGSQ